jgi:uncharacterized protein YdaU (DUF1376 family)
MHYYQHHIGDFIKATARLTDSQAMAYLRLIWKYYDDERPLLNEIDVLAFQVGASEHDVELILRSYFKLENDLWHQTRCDTEIDEYHQKAEQASKAGKASAQARLNKRLTDVEQPLNGLSTNHKPLTNNQEPVTKNQSNTNAEALDGFDEFWAIYEKKGNKMQSQKAWKKLKPSIELQLEIYAQARLYVQATPDKQFRKDASTWLNNHCWKDVLNPAKPKPKGFFAQLGMIGENHEQSQPPIALGLDR